MKYQIIDWMGSHVYTHMEFDSFEEARDFISQRADAIAFEEYPDDADEAKREELHQGICEDLYAEPINEDRDAYNRQQIGEK